MELTDFDLDVVNALKDFPTNNDDGFIFLRGKITDNNVSAPFIYAKASENVMRGIFYSIMRSDKEFARIILNVMFAYFEEEKGEAELFFSIAKEHNIGNSGR